MLDKLQVERERGITVKAQTASLFYNYEGQEYLLNLIDTPVGDSSDGRVKKEKVKNWHPGVALKIFAIYNTAIIVLLMLHKYLSRQGHVDFSYEVSRSISACQGVLLIVDANQVQTSKFWLCCVTVAANLQHELSS